MAKQRYKGQHAKTIDKALRESFFLGRVVVLEKTPDAVLYVFIIDDGFEGLSDVERDDLYNNRLRADVSEHVRSSIYHVTLLTNAELGTLRTVLQFLDDEKIVLRGVAHVLSHIVGIETWRKGFRHDL